MNVNLNVKLLHFEIKVAQREQDAECNNDRSVHAVGTPSGAKHTRSLQNEAFKTLLADKWL